MKLIFDFDFTISWILLVILSLQSCKTDEPLEIVDRGFFNVHIQQVKDSTNCLRSLRTLVRNEEVYGPNFVWTQDTFPICSYKETTNGVLLDFGISSDFRTHLMIGVEEKPFYLAYKNQQQININDYKEIKGTILSFKIDTLSLEIDTLGVFKKDRIIGHINYKKSFIMAFPKRKSKAQHLIKGCFYCYPYSKNLSQDEE